MSFCLSVCRPTFPSFFLSHSLQLKNGRISTLKWRRFWWWDGRTDHSEGCITRLNKFLVRFSPGVKNISYFLQESNHYTIVGFWDCDIRLVNCRRPRARPPPNNSGETLPKLLEHRNPVLESIVGWVDGVDAHALRRRLLTLSREHFELYMTLLRGWSIFEMSSMFFKLSFPQINSFIQPCRENSNSLTKAFPATFAHSFRVIILLFNIGDLLKQKRPPQPWSHS